MLRIVTLTTDWNLSDYYIGVVKANILVNCNDVTIIDISHDISNFSVVQAGFLMKSVYKNFPDGTIHLICVGSISEKKENIIVVKFDNQFFICNNNGLIGLIIDENQEFQNVAEISISTPNITFPEKDIFVKTVCKLLRNNFVFEQGITIPIIKRFPGLTPAIDFQRNRIEGNIIYVDSYGDAITNISKSVFNKINLASYEIFVGSPTLKITKISNNYYDVEEGYTVAVFNSLDLLEIAQRNGNLCEMFALNNSSPIIITFNNNW
ncbi:MAG: SAM-dependent chlorinase/fluorinase [Bacteroidales bacterium]|jgi:S-adenosylmethionine hydrolase|nr:SAM-dependent chlorinase/fluorinase [Bacteroidales bacterium]